MRLGSITSRLPLNLAFNLATTRSVIGLQTSLTRNDHPLEWLVPISPR